MALEKKMRTGFNKFFAFVFLLAFALEAYAVGTAIVTAVASAAFAATVTGTVIAMAINLVVSTVISKLLAPSAPSFGGADFSAGSAPDVGNRAQVPPATDNKLPVVYGQAWVGGTITDLSISENNQVLYYVLSICEVTSTNTGQTPDTFTFGNIYYGGKKVVFRPDGYTVASLLDESNGTSDTTVDGKIEFYLYNNGSFSPTNTGLTAIQVMQSSGLIYQWDSNKLMTNTVFAIVKLTYSQSANIRGIEQTRFQITNSRSNTGECFYDYLINQRYGCAIPEAQIDVNSLNELTAYSNQTFTYTDYNGNPATQPRFKFNGAVDTKRGCLDNLQDMSSCCDCLVKYNEVQAKWGVIVQKPDYTVAMNINDSNMISAISITPMDISSSYNIVECRFPDESNQDAFNVATFDLAQIAPQLLYPNEPINKFSLALPLVNNDVQAQYIANRTLESAREDLNVSVDVNYIGLELEAGDIVTVTNSNYGWVNKLFRLNKVVQSFSDDGAIIVKLQMSEFNPDVYDDKNITQFNPSPNTGIGDPGFFSTIPTPIINNIQPSAVNPSFDVVVTTPNIGIVQYAELWYSAFPNPAENQRLFAGTTAIQSSGNPYPANFQIATTLANIPAGNWYFFTRMVNSIATSAFSLPSLPIDWRPLSFQYPNRYLAVAYADNIFGGGFSFLPTNKDWFGLSNQATAFNPTNPNAYTWYPANPAFGTNNFLLYTNRQNRRFTFSIGEAVYASQTGAYVPADTSVYDQSVWAALPINVNLIDLDARTGQLLTVGTSTVSPQDGLLKVTNTETGKVVAALERFLNFGPGVVYKTSSVASLTVDIYGRVVGFTDPDNFYYTASVFDATAGQDTFSLPHTVGNILVFKNGSLLGSSDYTEDALGFTLTNPCIAGEKIVVVNMRATSTNIYYEPLNIQIASSTTNSITYSTITSPYQDIQAGDELTFSNIGVPTAYTVASVNYATRVITFTSTISGATAGFNVYRYRAAGSEYRPFTKYEVNLTNATSYTPTEWQLRNGFELIFVNGSSFNELDYDLGGNTISALPAPTTGTMTIIQFNENSFGIPCANAANSLATTVTGQTEYPFPHNVDAFNLYANGMILADTYDYTSTESLYTLLNTPDNSFTLLQQQTFARVGPA